MVVAVAVAGVAAMVVVVLVDGGCEASNNSH